MVLALDPRYPRVWRTPDTLQFGVDAPRLVLEGVGLAEERMIAALADGVSAPGLRMIAKRARADARAVEALLDRLAPVLLRAPARASPSGVAADGVAAAGLPADRAMASGAVASGAVASGGRESPVVVLDGEGPTAARVLGLLRETGVDARAGLAWSDPVVEAAVCAVIVGSFAIEPARHARWLRRDVRHLPVVFGDAGVVVGPLVVPGRGPCVRCGDLHRADADPAWPAMAAQVHARPRFGESAAVADAVAGVVATVVAATIDGGERGHAGRGGGIRDARRGGGIRGEQRGGGIRGERRGGRRASSQVFDPSTGRWSVRGHMPHPECGCLGLTVSPAAPGMPERRGAPAGRAPRGSATPAAAPDDRAGSRDAPS